MNRLFALSFLFLATASAAQPLPHDRTPKQRPMLLVMGSAHFANPGTHLRQATFVLFGRIAHEAFQKFARTVKLGASGID